MATYSVAEAKNKLTQLIAAAERGEAVTITRHGRPVVELRAVGSPDRAPMTLAALDALQAEAARLGLPRLAEDSASLLRRLRDEDER